MAILTLVDSKAPYGAHGVKLIPDTPLTVPDGALLEAFLANPGVKARVKSGKIRVEGHRSSARSADEQKK